MAKTLTVEDVGTRNERAITLKDGVLFVVFKATGEWRPASRETCARFRYEWTAAQDEAHENHVKETIETYKKARARRSPAEIAEERAEMRAAFGSGARVVNVLTGEETVL